MTSSPVAAPFDVPLPAGVVTVPAFWTGASAPRAAVLLAPGAGAGHDHPFLVGLAEALAELEVSTLRFDFPYRAQGRRMPGPAAQAVAGWRAADAAVERLAPGVPRIAAGKSYGGRMASMAAAEGAIAPAALVYLGYPLHPPGKPEALRVEHLPGIAAPQLFLSGETDPFVDPHAALEQAVASCHDATLQWVPGNHSFEVRGHKRPAAALGASLAPLLAEWLAPRI